MKLGVQKHGKIPYLRTPPDPDSARIRILFYNYFFCSIISGTLEVTDIYLHHFMYLSGTPEKSDTETRIIERFTQN